MEKIFLGKDYNGFETEESLKMVDDYLVNDFDFDFPYEGFHIWFGEGEDRGSIYMKDDNDNIVKYDGFNVIVYAYEYEEVYNNDEFVGVELTIEKEEGYVDALLIAESKKTDCFIIGDGADDDLYIYKTTNPDLFYISGYEVETYVGDIISAVDAYLDDNYQKNDEYIEDVKEWCKND